MPAFPDAGNTHSTLLGLQLSSHTHSTSEQRAQNLLHDSGPKRFFPQHVGMATWQYEILIRGSWRYRLSDFVSLVVMF